MDSNLDIKEEPVWREDHFETVTVAALPETDTKEELDVKFKEEVTAEVFIPKVEKEEEEESPSSIENEKEAAHIEECDVSRVLVKDIHPSAVESEVMNSPESTHNRETSELQRELQKSFLYHEDLQKLMSTHNRVMWCCHYCGKSFENESLLRNHMIDHNKEKEPSLLIESGVDSLVNNEKRFYCCDHCGKSSYNSDDIINHMKDHEKAKPYRCKVCLKAYQQQSNLQRHLQSRHKERRYFCSICSQAFTRHDSLRRHELRHSEVCHLSCPVCDRSYVERAKLNKHILKHKLERSFSCSVCGKSYTQRSSLLRHQLVHSDNKNPYSSKI